MKKVLFVGVLLNLLLCSTINAQKWGITTNALYWATSTPNIGVEYAFHSRMSLAASASYNPFTFGNNHKLKHVLGQIEYRYWLNSSFKGHFFGVHAQGGVFNFSGLPLTNTMRDYRFEGNAYGGGFTYGYQWTINQRFRIGAEIGLGYLYLDYDKFYCPTCGERIDHYRNNYLGPTKAAVSLVYLLK